MRWIIALWWRLRCLLALGSARRRSLARLRGGPIRRVLVVCYGNINRSAFVGAHLEQKKIAGVEIRSAGVYPHGGRLAPRRMLETGRLCGVDLTAHRSSVVRAIDLLWADTIVLMDRHNWQALMRMRADQDKFVWLGTLDSGKVEIPDPHKMDDESASVIAARLDSCTRRLAEAINKIKAPD